MVAALLAQRARTPSTPEREDTSLAILVLNGAVRHEAVSFLRQGGLRALMSHWKAPADVVDEAVARLSAALAPPAIFGAASLPPVFLDSVLADSVDCPLVSLLFGAAVAAGWPWALALRLFAGLGRGSPCNGGHTFIPDRGRPLSPGAPCRAASVASSADPSVVMTILFDDEGVALLSCTRAVFGSAASLHGPTLAGPASVALHA